MNNKLLFRIGIVAMSAMLAVAVYLALVFYPFLTEAARDDIDVIFRALFPFISIFIAPVAGLVLYLRKKPAGLTLCAGYAIFMTAASVFCIGLTEFNVANVLTVILYLASAVVYLLPQTRFSFDPESSPVDNALNSLMWAVLLVFIVIGPVLLPARYIGMIVGLVLLLLVLRGFVGLKK